MDGSTTRKRPWLAAMLALPVTGLGHVYLRRWKRAIGWLLVATAASILFVPPAVMESVDALANASFWDLFPVTLTVAMSAVDAYLLARRQNLTTEIRGAQRCPQCYHELSADVEFCEWCGAELPTRDGH